MLLGFPGFSLAGSALLSCHLGLLWKLMPLCAQCTPCRTHMAQAVHRAVGYPQISSAGALQSPRDDFQIFAYFWDTSTARTCWYLSTLGPTALGNMVEKLCVQPQPSQGHRHLLQIAKRCLTAIELLLQFSILASTFWGPSITAAFCLGHNGCSWYRIAVPRPQGSSLRLAFSDGDSGACRRSEGAAGCLSLYCPSFRARLHMTEYRGFYS